MICASSTCDNDIDEIVMAWEESGRKGRPPKYCRDPECRRVRVAERNRRSRRRRRPRSAVPRNWQKLPEEIDFIDADTWRADVAETERLDALHPEPKAGRVRRTQEDRLCWLFEFSG